MRSNFHAHTAHPPGVTKRHNHVRVKLEHACKILENYKIRIIHKGIFCVLALSYVCEHCNVNLREMVDVPGGGS